MNRKKQNKPDDNAVISGTGLSKPWWPANKAIEPMCQSPLRLPGYVIIAILIIVTTTLNVVGLKWGLPNSHSWNADSIAGLKTVKMVPQLYKSWITMHPDGSTEVERYPRAQFLITGTLYKPFLKHWLRNPVPVRNPRTGKTVISWASIERVSTLILVSRIVTVAMAVGAVLGVFATTRLLTQDSLAGFLAAMVLMLSGEFTYFSHLGNLDTPVTFWFIWTAYSTVRALQTGRFKYFVLMGLFAGMVVCTKDASAGHLAALAIFTTAAAAYHYYQQRERLADVRKVAVEPRLWLAMGCFMVVFAVMNNVITDWAAFTARVQHWVTAKESYIGPAGQQWRLICEAVNCVRFSCGFWMFIAMIASFVYCLIRHPVKAFWAVGPFVMFHIAITTNALLVRPRYHLPSLACLAAIFGIAASDLLRTKHIAAIFRVAPLVIVLGLAGMYAAAVDAEMMSDSRYSAEQWIRENLDKDRDTITFISPILYMPRSENEGYKVIERVSKMTTRKVLADRPKLIGLSNKWYEDRFHFDQQFKKELLNEELGYRRVAEFTPRFTIPGKGPFGVATMMTHGLRIVSPKIIFMERID